MGTKTETPLTVSQAEAALADLIARIDNGDELISVAQIRAAEDAVADAKANADVAARVASAKWERARKVALGELLDQVDSRALTAEVDDTTEKLTEAIIAALDVASAAQVARHTLFHELRGLAADDAENLAGTVKLTDTASIHRNSLGRVGHPRVEISVPQLVIEQITRDTIRNWQRQAKPA